MTVLQGGRSLNIGHGTLGHLLQARNPTVYFSTFIGDSVLTLPTLRALAGMFAAPLTLMCPQTAFDLCFWEVSPRFVDITGVVPAGPPIGAPAHRTLDYETLGIRDRHCRRIFQRSAVGHAVERLYPLPLATPGSHLERRLPDRDDYDIIVPRDLPHSADLTFKLARLFDPALQIESYAQPVPLPPSVQHEARSIRAAVPAGVKVLVVHADTNWEEKRWSATRFIDVLDRFLSRHRDFVAWVVGMGHEELNVGRERDRVLPYLGLPLDSHDGLGRQRGPLPGDRLLHAPCRRSGARAWGRPLRPDPGHVMGVQVCAPPARRGDIAAVDAAIYSASCRTFRSRTRPSAMMNRN